MAVVLVGEERLGSLREWFEPLPPEGRLAIREAAFSFAIHALVADGVCSEAEGTFLEEVFDACAMTREERGRWHDLVAAAMRERRRLSHPETIAEVCDHPVLREILLAVAWHVMGADGSVVDEERATFSRLARLFSIDEPRATEIAETVDAYRA
jgi:tellurite resistance protein